MRTLHAILTVAALAATAIVAGAQSTPYTPQAQFCVNGSTSLCPILPGNIGPDPMLDTKVAYNGINGSLPTSAAKDVQTPFDNLSWQTFMALNWAKGAEKLPASVGLRAGGPRVWETYDRVSKVFGNGTVQGNCHTPAGMPTFSMASNGQGQPVAQNEEYIEAADGDPAIDVAGNWAIYERRVNNIEIAYLKAPGGKTAWNLTTIPGQQALINANGTVNFPSMLLGGSPNGAIEIKAAWRILDPNAPNAKRFFTEQAMLIVAPDLVAHHGPAKPICAPVTLGLVAMHIIQKNPLTNNSLLPEWFWSTFEQVDNAPPAAAACNPAQPSTCSLLGKTACPAALYRGAPQFSFYNVNAPDVTTNQPPQLLPGGQAFLWSPAQPYASIYLAKSKSGLKVGTQITRCWQIYALTQKLNAQWRTALQKVGSVFANYMLVGTQWGAGTTNTPDPQIPSGGVPNFLSNTVVETYLQMLAKPVKNQNDAFGNGSCVTCHQSAALVDNKTLANLSFLPNLAQPGLLRRPPNPPRP